LRPFWRSRERDLFARVGRRAQQRRAAKNIPSEEAKK